MNASMQTRSAEMTATPAGAPERARSFLLPLAEGQTAEIETLNPATLAAEAEQWTTISGAAGEWGFRARVGVAGLEAALRAFHPFFAWSDLSPEDASSAVQWLANATAAESPALRSFPVRLDVNSLAQEAGFAPQFAFRVNLSGAVIPVLLDAPGHFGQRLRRLVSTHPNDPILAGGATARVRLCLGFARLTAQEMRDLQTGDAIELDLSGIEQRQCYALTQGGFAQTCEIRGDQAILSGPLLSRPLGVLSAYVASEGGAASSDAVVLAFEIGAAELPVGPLDRFGAGHAFELGAAPVGQVEITADGHRLGLGEIVRFDGRSCVRVGSLTP